MSQILFPLKFKRRHKKWTHSNDDESKKSTRFKGEDERIILYKKCDDVDRETRAKWNLESFLDSVLVFRMLVNSPTILPFPRHYHHLFTFHCRYHKIFIELKLSRLRYRQSEKCQLLIEKECDSAWIDSIWTFWSFVRMRIEPFEIWNG